MLSWSGHIPWCVPALILTQHLILPTISHKIWVQDSFDFIHVRNISQAVSDWPQLLAQAHRCCKPGGYIELAEIGLVAYSDDNTLPSGIIRYLELLSEGLVKLGRPPHVTGETLRGNLEKAGLVPFPPYAYWQVSERWSGLSTFRFTATSSRLLHGQRTQNLSESLVVHHVYVFCEPRQIVNADDRVPGCNVIAER
jgi:SAM-dependent methyltransferase